MGKSLAPTPLSLISLDSWETGPESDQDWAKVTQREAEASLFPATHSLTAHFSQVLRSGPLGPLLAVVGLQLH